jgi:hypothetical protein
VSAARSRVRFDYVCHPYDAVTPAAAAHIFAASLRGASCRAPPLMRPRQLLRHDTVFAHPFSHFIRTSGTAVRARTEDMTMTKCTGETVRRRHLRMLAGVVQLYPVGGGRRPERSGPGPEPGAG